MGALEPPKGTSLTRVSLLAAFTAVPRPLLAERQRHPTPAIHPMVGAGLPRAFRGPPPDNENQSIVIQTPSRIL
jgi:hypothetical protein